MKMIWDIILRLRLSMKLPRKNLDMGNKLLASRDWNWNLGAPMSRHHQPVGLEVALLCLTKHHGKANWAAEGPNDADASCTGDFLAPNCWDVCWIEHWCNVVHQGIMESLYISWFKKQRAQKAQSHLRSNSSVLPWTRWILPYIIAGAPILWQSLFHHSKQRPVAIKSLN